MQWVSPLSFFGQWVRVLSDPSLIKTQFIEIPDPQPADLGNKKPAIYAN
jgi:hypothetical protein